MSVLSAIVLAGVLTPASLAADLDRIGPRATVARLVEGGDWPRTMSAIAGGGRDWIRLAPQLARGSDSDRAQDIGIALAEALPKAAADVLEATGQNAGPALSVDRVCGVPFVEATVADIPAYVQRARAAVTAVPPLALGRARTACLKALDEATQDIARAKP